MNADHPSVVNLSVCQVLVFRCVTLLLRGGHVAGWGSGEKFSTGLSYVTIGHPATLTIRSDDEPPILSRSAADSLGI